MLSERFSSIKWKFIVVYFLLVFIAMIIVATFIVGRLESQQIENVNRNMETRIESMLSSSSYLMQDDWEKVKEDIQKTTIDDWRLDNKEDLYVISVGEYPEIIATSIKRREDIIGDNALSSEYMETYLLMEALEGKKAINEPSISNSQSGKSHIAYPVEDGVGKVKGIIYMTYDLRDIANTMRESKVILTNATIIALVVTVSLGYLIADSIIDPIRDLTKKVEEMAEGDFDQKVDVRSRDEIGQLASMFNYLTGELKLRIEEIDLERSKLDTIFNSMAEGVVAIGLDGYLIHANPIALEILDMNKDLEFTSEDSKIKFPYDKVNLENLESGNREEFKGDEIVELKGEIYKIKYAPFKSDSGETNGVILVFQNMTNEHRLDNMRKEFVANVSHELKTPITTIKSYTETLMLGDIAPDTQLAFLQVIDDESNRMNRLVQDLLQLSNMDFKETAWEKEEVKVNPFVESVVKKMNFAFKEKNQSYKLKLQEDIPNFHIDRDAIEQVLLNIISNASKYTESGGNINILTGSSENFITIKVEDDGLGIPKEDLDRIFDRFYRVEKARSRDTGGTGLGLSIAKEIIKGHNGYIEISSELDKGTTVEIKLPIAPCNE